MPLQRATDGKTTMTQFEMHACEALGLLKFDFLGLINLTILADAVELVEKHRGIDLDVDNLPLDDAQTFELLVHRRHDGRVPAGRLRHAPLRQGAEADRGARPGRHGRPLPAGTDGEHPRVHQAQARRGAGHLPPRSLEPALRDTYGIFVYQEDIMTAAIAMADYTGPEADNLCYAIRKKKEDVLRQHEAKFKAGAKKKGIPPHIVDQVFAEFEPFARYGFNKAHATCYGLIAYQTAYLKANYPIEFMTAVLNGFRERAEKVAAVIAECRHLGIEVRPPDVQRSFATFTVETDASGAPEAIRFGMAAIKNVGEGAIEAIAAVREGGEEPVRSLPGRLLPARRPAHINNASWSRSSRPTPWRRWGRPVRCSRRWTSALENGRATSATWRPASRRCSTCSRCPADRAGSGSWMAGRRSRAASGCAGRRSSSACTCPSTRWAISPTSCRST